MNKKVKIAIAGGAAAVLMVTGGLLAYFQPWKETQDEPPADQQKQDDKKPEEDQDKDKEKDEPFIMVGGEKLPCTLHEGEGWSILVPAGWTVEGDTIWPDKVKAPDAWLRVTRDGEAHGMEFTSVWERDGLCGYVLSVGTESPCEIVYQAKQEEFPACHQVFRAMVQTFEKGGKYRFKSLIGSQKPDLHVDNGETVLFMDKLGVSVDEYAQKAVTNRMLTWPEESRAGYTGAYHVEKPVVFEASYTTSEQFIDVFSATAVYELSKGSKVTGDDVHDGSRYEKFYLILSHSGDGIEESRAFWDTPAPLPGSQEFFTAAFSPADNLA